MLLYGTPSSPLAQPRNLLGGQLIGALVGCTIRWIFREDGEKFLAVVIAVALSLLIMQITATMHAPAGATAVIAITSTKVFPWAGFQFILLPVLSGSLILLIIAVIVNNLVSARHYPLYWW
jgi:CBS domain-containing membrane protein